MSNAIASVNLSQQAFPPGTVVGDVVFTLLDNTGKAVASKGANAGQNDATAAATFPSVPPGTGYTISVQRVDGSGAVLGAPAVSDPFDVVVVTPVLVTVPSGAVNVTLG